MPDLVRGIASRQRSHDWPTDDTQCRLPRRGQHCGALALCGVQEVPGADDGVALFAEERLATERQRFNLTGCGCSVPAATCRHLQTPADACSKSRLQVSSWSRVGWRMGTGSASCDGSVGSNKRPRTGRLLDSARVDVCEYTSHIYKQTDRRWDPLVARQTAGQCLCGVEKRKRNEDDKWKKQAELGDRSGKRTGAGRTKTKGKNAAWGRAARAGATRR